MKKTSRQKHSQTQEMKGQQGTKSSGHSTTEKQQETQGEEEGQEAETQ